MADDFKGSKIVDDEAAIWKARDIEAVVLIKRDVFPRVGQKITLGFHLLATFSKFKSLTKCFYINHKLNVMLFYDASYVKKAVSDCHLPVTNEVESAEQVFIDE
ncbi:hypothetical protein T4B_246 [Trichinella pseudospiralis]|uniref:Uncharacterized protein n=2 Tax=Trichinella pseudospiralis TaxID=6337 RepID=A0A0V1G4J9_TRIPS|nr:hypothetical protein T4E_2953 [Trichinella pseudospiralis]KRY78683.1 hypothetical protein T4A_2161 [Trichinella pseudospiralis]KRY93089.1 hypothetical protein T4D_9890 [Trichinella pseudospiralis]KRZ32885.1 hypothetical protein T4B_246 [Trichinella pseudospiralis]KRZ46329.1 hypothetical protein T4C_5506 [Trichinella pseudospiralis]